MKNSLDRGLSNEVSEERHSEKGVDAKEPDNDYNRHFNFDDYILSSDQFNGVPPAFRKICNAFYIHSHDTEKFEFNKRIY